MDKKGTILKLLVLCILMGTPKAFALTDDEANRIITQTCLNYKEKINTRIITKILSMNGVQRRDFELGECADYTYHGGQKAIAFSLPNEFSTDAFDDGVRPIVLDFTAGNSYGRRQTERMVFQFYWKKTPVYNNLGNLVGYDYKFYDHTKGDMDSTRYFYWITNRGSGESAGTVDINRN